MVGSEKLVPPIFEEASKHIVDPNYGLGLVWLWQLANTHPFHRAAAIHDLRYDYLDPGENTLEVDAELSKSFRDVIDSCAPNNSMLCIQHVLFTKLARVRGELYELGPSMCSTRGYHAFTPCTYGQEIIYDERCSTCGLHRPSRHVGEKINRI